MLVSNIFGNFSLTYLGMIPNLTNIFVCRHGGKKRNTSYIVVDYFGIFLLFPFMSVPL